MSEKKKVSLNIFERLASLSSKIGPKAENRLLREQILQDCYLDPKLSSLRSRFGKSTVVSGGDEAKESNIPKD